jgi:hypothetical protein
MLACRLLMQRGVHAVNRAGRQVALPPADLPPQIPELDGGLSPKIAWNGWAESGLAPAVGFSTAPSKPQQIR